MNLIQLFNQEIPDPSMPSKVTLTLVTWYYFLDIWMTQVLHLHDRTLMCKNEPIHEFS